MKRNSKWVSGEGGVRGTWKSITADGDGGGLSAIANNTVLGNISGISAIPIGLTAQQLGNLAVQSGVWTPVLTFSTPGNLSVAYGTQEGLYLRIGNLVIATFRLFTSSFTHTTASGTLDITGLPFAAANVTQPYGILGDLQGVTKANFTQFVPRGIQNTSLIRLSAMGSAQAVAQLAPADMPTAGSVRLAGTVLYTV